MKHLPLLALFGLLTSTLTAMDPFEKIERSNEEWKEILPPANYEILREEGTETPFTSPLNDEHRSGTFVCFACELPLFKSEHKYDSGTGWPSFYDVIEGHIGTKRDWKLIIPRTEYHCARCGGHQGHIFKDGPEPTGLRYCNNGLALKFIPDSSDNKSSTASASIKIEKALFAGGCFWCMQKPFEDLPGVIDTTVGYTGGRIDNPTYEQVSKEDTGHYEAIEVQYNPNIISYDKILDTFWRNIDPFDSSGQFCDRGDSYKSAIFYTDAETKSTAELSKAKIQKQLGKNVYTPIIKAAKFYPAEDYHQDYHKKNPIRYKFYRTSCGRDNRLDEVWGE